MTDRTGRAVPFALGLIAVAVAARLAPHPWGLTPLTAVALFGGAMLPGPWAVLGPLAAIALSDALLGFHATVPFTWGSILLISVMGRWLRQRVRPATVVAGSLSGSLLFYLITNFGVWLLGGLYTPDGQGLLACYAAGLPFFRAALVGDLLYAMALFGLHALAVGRQPAVAIGPRA